MPVIFIFLFCSVVSCCNLYKQVEMAYIDEWQWSKTIFFLKKL